MAETLLQTGSPALMRKINAVRVLREIRANGPATRSAVARAAGLSKPTVADVVEHLRTQGLVRQTESGDGGRHPLFEFCADKHRVLGIDIGADKLLVIVADLDGSILTMIRRDTAHLTGRPPDELLRLIDETAYRALDETAPFRGELLSVTVGTPGVITADGRVSLAPQIAGWEGLELQATLSKMFTCAVHIEREVILSLLAEQWLGVAQNLDDALFVQLGVGVGASLLLNGQVYRGADGSAGEIGFMPVAGVARGVESTRFGSFESVVGGNALGARGSAAIREEPTGLLASIVRAEGGSVTAKHVFDAARIGDTRSTQIIAEALDVLAEGIAAIACVLNPQAVILSGGLSHAGEQLRVPLEERVARLVPFPPRFFTSLLGEESVAMGAIRRATREIEESLIFAEEEVT